MTKTDELYPCQREWRKKNKDKIKEYNRRYYEKKKLKPLSVAPRLEIDQTVLVKTLVEDSIPVDLPTKE
jgi:hypothetical protein